MNISFEIPPDIGRQLGPIRADLSHEAKEAFLVELYRKHEISHRQLGEALGFDPHETDGLLKRHDIGLGITDRQVRDEASALRDARPG